MPETFNPIQWINDTFPAINSSNLNRVEQGLESLDDRAASLELGVVTPVTVPYATSVTLNATQGALFRCIASGDITLDDVVGGIDGQVIVFEVQASGAQRILHFTGSTDSVTIAAGQWWVGTLRFIATGNIWLLDDGSGAAGGGSSSGGNDLNVLAPHNLPYAGTITPNAATGALFRITAPGDFTLAEPINGTDGQAVVVEVLASGGNRTVSFVGATSVTIPSGSRWTATLRFNQADNVWLMVSGGSGGGGGGTSGVVSVNGLTGAVVLDADDLADGSTKVQMTTAERAKLGGVATGATANATDAELRNRATHTGTQPVSSLTTSGTANSTTFLRGDGAWSAPVATPAVSAIDVPDVGDANQRIAWPAYVHPLLSGSQGNYWDRALKFAPQVEILIANIDAVGGPGTTVNSDYTTAIEKAKASGVTVLGYVDTSYTARASATVTNEVSLWRSLYPTVDGIFFDQVSVNPVDVPYYQTLYNFVKGAFPTTTRRLVVLNPGVFTDEAYMACCDVIMNFENTPANYRIKFAPAWERKYPARRFWHVVHSIASLTEMREMIALSRRYRAGYVYLTDDTLSPSPFDTLPNDPFWVEQVTSTAAVDPTWATTVVSANTQTGTAYTLVIGDAGGVVEMNNGSANTVTVPPNSSVAYPIGTVVEVTQVGAGQTSLAAGSGVTLRAASGTSLRTQWSGASLRKRGTDEWVVTGDLV